LENKLYSAANLKENVEIVVKLVTIHSIARIVRTTMAEIAVMEQEKMFTYTVANWAMTRRVASKSNGRKLKMLMPVILTVTLTGETTSHKMRFSRRLKRTRSYRIVLGFVKVERADITASQIKVYLM
jgi:hypothetical protein